MVIKGQSERGRRLYLAKKNLYYNMSHKYIFMISAFLLYTHVFFFVVICVVFL